MRRNFVFIPITHRRLSLWGNGCMMKVCPSQTYAYVYVTWTRECIARYGTAELVRVSRKQTNCAETTSTVILDEENNKQMRFRIIGSDANWINMMVCVCVLFQLQYNFMHLQIITCFYCHNVQYLLLFLFQCYEFYHHTRDNLKRVSLKLYLRISQYPVLNQASM